MASFHKNILNRMVRDLEVRLAVEDFEHEFRILFCPTRVEAHLVARKDSQIEVNSRKSWFASGDSIRTDISWKHTPSEFAELIAASGWTSVTSWTNPGSAYALHLLRATCEFGPVKSQRAEHPSELTICGMLIGGAITVVFMAANVYLGLRTGMTFSSSIPAAIISMSALRALGHSGILENNIVQT